MSIRYQALLPILLSFLYSSSPAHPATVELRLVVHDQTETTVDKMERQRPIVNPVSTSQGVQMTRIGLDLVCWARNIRLDGQPIFERYHEGKYVDRLPVARADLLPGSHVIWPGNHAFTLGDDGQIKTEDAELLVEGQVLRIKCYPVTLRAYRANPGDGDLPLSMRLSPLPDLTIRESANAEETALKKPDDRDKGKVLELLPLFDQFVPLTVWLPANKSGKGYLVHPLGLTFHLGPEGITAGAGGGQPIEGLLVKKDLVEIPLYNFPVTGSAGGQAIVPGVEVFKWDETSSERTYWTNWSPRTEPYHFRVSQVGPSIPVDGDLQKLPVKTMRVDVPDPAAGMGRGLVVEMETRHLTLGVVLRARIRAVDPSNPVNASKSLGAAAAKASASGRTAKAAQDSAGRRLEALNASYAEGVSKAKESGTPGAAGIAGAVEASKPKIEAAQEALKKAQAECASAVASAAAAETKVTLAAKEMASGAASADISALWADAAKALAESTASMASAAAAFESARAACSSAAEILQPLLAEDASHKLSESAKSFEIAGGHLARGPEALRQASRDFQDAEARRAAPENLLADAPPWAQVQALDRPEWIDLKVEPATHGEFLVAIPDLSPGAYRFRLGVRPGQQAARPIATEQWVSVAAESPAGIGLFTARGRRAFYRGESFWIGLAISMLKQPLPAGSALEADLVDESGRRFSLIREKLAQALADRETFVIRVDEAISRGLAPGPYRVEARVGAHSPRALLLDIVEPEPRTHFTNMMIGKYSAFNRLYEGVLRTGHGADGVARELVSAGYNAFKGMSYDMHRVYREGTDLEQLVRERPELGPWESYYSPSGRDRFLDAAVRHNLRFYENMFTYNDTMLPRDPGILDACERYLSLEVASLRHSPAFHGVCLYDEIYHSADTGTAMSQLFFKAQEVAYRNKHPGMTSAEALRALDRFAGRPPGQRRYEDLAKYRTWPAHEDSEWKSFSDRMAAAAKDVMPDSQNFTLQRFWGTNGGNLATNGTASDVFASLDAAACVMYKDGGYGDRPVFAPMQADVLRIRDGFPVWTQMHGFSSPGLYGRHHLRQAFFALSQKIEGLTFFTIPFDPHYPSALDNRDTIRDITSRLCTPYGDLFLSLEKGYRKVAIYYSREADYLTPRKPVKPTFAAEGLWVACMRAGFPADFLYDEQIRAGKGLEYQVLFAPGFLYEDEAPPDTLAALRRFVDSGKILAVERSSKLPIEGLHRLDSDFDEYDNRYGGTMQFVDFESEAVWDQSGQTTALVREFLARHVPPAAQQDRLVGPDWLRGRGGEYLFISNFAFTGFNSLHKTLYQAPDCPTLRFPRRPPACYDMLEMRPVDVAVEGDWMTLEADLRHYPGKIYAFLPAAIAKLNLQASESLIAGRDLNYHITVCDAEDKVIDACFPLEIILKDPQGKTRHEIYRAAAPQYRGAYRMPVNAAEGKWTLTVRDLISGVRAESDIRVSAGQLPLARLDSRRVWIEDSKKIARFLAAQDPVIVAIDDEQPGCRPHAERLCKALADRGRQARIAPVREVLRLPVDWDNMAPTVDGCRLWRGDVVQPGLHVDASLILLGRRGENRLIEALVRRDVLASSITAHFPGPGKALLAWTRSAFSNHHDTVTVLANDETGLTQGLDALLSLDPEKESQPAHPPVARPQPDASAQLTAARKIENAPSRYGDAISAEDLIRSLDVDSTTGRILVGTFGFGENLFCFSSEGQLLWKKFLPEHNVYFARWYDGGQRVLAATGQGFFIFLLRGADGQVLKKFSSTEWPRHHGGFNTYQEGAVNTELSITLNPPLRQFLIGGLTGLLAVDYDGNKMWFFDRAETLVSYPKEAEQSVAAEFGRFAAVGNFALSPDGLKIIASEERVIGSTPSQVPGKVTNLWQHVPRVLDSRTGQVILENLQDPGNQTSPGNWWVSWPKESETPWVNTGQLAAPLHADGRLGPYLWQNGERLKGGGFLRKSPTEVLRVDPHGQTLWKLSGDTLWIPELDSMDAAESRLYRCSREGLVHCVDLTTGLLVWGYQLPFSARLHPAASGELVAGTNNGILARFSLEGKLLWQSWLRGHHAPLPARSSYATFLEAERQRDPDASSEFYPVGQDQPGEYEGILRLGVEQLAHGDFEDAAGWMCQTGDVRRVSPGLSGNSMLALQPGQLVTQRLTRRVIPSATYLLEFHYRVGDPQTRLVAGALLASPAGGTLSATRFAARPGEWTFGRLAIKSFEETDTLDVGFEAEGGPLEIDNVSLRPVRFPSANLLANSELHAIPPTFVKDLRVQYDRIPIKLREKLMHRNHVAAFVQGLPTVGTVYTQEQAFLHNGRLDDVGPIWIHQPDYMGYSVILKQPAYVSHLVLYLNNAAPGAVYPTISVQANNWKTKLPELVALIRGNRRRFIVVHFPKPIQTDSLKVLPGPFRALRECLTEIEVYGPLGGLQLGEKSFPKDPEGWPMFMASPTHVPEKLPQELLGEWAERGTNGYNSPSYYSGATAVLGQFTASEANGAVHSFLVPEKGTQRQDLAWGPAWGLATVTPTTTPARYAGRLLVGCADYKLHAVADNGTPLWTFQTGGRVYSSPLPHRDDVYFGSDDGKLYKVDVDSGTLIWEFATGGKVRSAPALAKNRVYVASWDGFLYSLDAESGLLSWKSPIAPYTQSSPAVLENRVFLGDEQGNMLCFNAETGDRLWQNALEGYISACPVVAGEQVTFTSEQGNVASVSLAGNVLWKRSIETRITGQPVATTSQILIPSEKGLVVLRQNDGQPDDRLIPPPPRGKVLSVLPYRGLVCMTVGFVSVNYHHPPRTYAEFRGFITVWGPK